MTLAQARSEYQGLLLSEVVQRAQQSLGRELADGWVRQFERTAPRYFVENWGGPRRSQYGAARKGRRHPCMRRFAGQPREDADYSRPDGSALAISRARHVLGRTGAARQPDLFLHAAATMRAQRRHDAWWLRTPPLASPRPSRPACARSATPPTAMRRPSVTPEPSYSTRLRSYRRCWGSRLEPRERLTKPVGDAQRAGVYRCRFAALTRDAPLRGHLPYRG